MLDESSFSIFNVNNGKKRLYAYRAAGGGRRNCPSTSNAVALAAVGEETGQNRFMLIEPAPSQSGPGVL